MLQCPVAPAVALAEQGLHTISSSKEILLMVDQPSILALDIGTSSTRALLYDARGVAIPGAHAQLAYQLTTSHEGEASVDADFLLGLVIRTIDEVLQAAGE